MERLPPWQDRRDPNVCVLVPSLVPCATSSAAKGDQAAVEHGLVLGVDAGPSCCKRTPWWKQFESIWTDSILTFSASVMQFKLFSQKIPIYAPTAFLFWEMGTCHMGEERPITCFAAKCTHMQCRMQLIISNLLWFFSIHLTLLKYLDKWKLSVCFFCLEKEAIVQFVIFWFVYCR